MVWQGVVEKIWGNFEIPIDFCSHICYDIRVNKKWEVMN